MSENKGKGVKRNEGNISDERPTKTLRIDAEIPHTQDEIPGQGQGEEGQGQPIPLTSVRYNGKIKTFGMSTLCMDFDGETGQILKESLIESIQSCPTDLDLICSDGVAFAHRFILMGISDFFFRLLRDRDTKDTEAITLVNVSITHLLLALDLIYSGDAIVKQSDEDGLLEVLDLFEIKMNLERKESTVEDVAMCGDTVEQAEVSIEEDDEDSKMQTVEENGVPRGNEAENEKTPKNNASTVEDVIVIEEDVCSETPVRTTDNGTETVALATNANYQVCRAGPDSQPQEMETEQSPPPLDESKRQGRPRNLTTAAMLAGPGQLDLRPSYPTEGHITLNEKKIRWHLMEALPSLTSPELQHERMRVFSLNVIKRPREDLYVEVRELFNSLPEDSLEKRLGMMAVQCENYKEIDLVELLQWCNFKTNLTGDANFFFYMIYLELFGNPPGCANMVRDAVFGGDGSAFNKPSTFKEEMLKDKSARYNLITYERLIYGDKPIEQDRLLEISKIEGLEDRAKALIKMNVAGRIAMLFSFMAPHFGWHEDYLNRYSTTEIGGSGWGVLWDHFHWNTNRDFFRFNATRTQILFPMLVKDVNLAEKVVIEGLFEKIGYGPVGAATAVTPKCLLENGIGCFPVVQKPGMLIYKYNGDDRTTTCCVSKLRLGVGADITM